MASKKKAPKKAATTLLTGAQVLFQDATNFAEKLGVDVRFALDLMQVDPNTDPADTLEVVNEAAEKLGVDVRFALDLIQESNEKPVGETWADVQAIATELGVDARFALDIFSSIAVEDKPAEE
jgi:phosphoserine phosphatase